MGNFAYYRAAWKAAGKNLRRTFMTYSAAKEFAERTARELPKGEQPIALSNREFTDALAVRAALNWADVWRVAGHVEITHGKANTRQRRLVEVCPALCSWLEPQQGERE